MTTDLYIRARSREGRLLDDAVVAGLPEVPPDHPHAAEWRLRAGSCRRLLAELRAQRRPLRVLELGCGNGWLAHRIAELPGSRVRGADVNDVELEQARRVFGQRGNLDFVHHDMRRPELPMPTPDLLVLASSVQYVEDTAPLIEAWLAALAPGGELHILDSPLYHLDEVAAAQERTLRHYAEIGVPEMAEAYLHHTWESLQRFHLEVLHRPDASLARLRRRLLGGPSSPFPWIRIRKDAVR